MSDSRGISLVEVTIAFAITAIIAALTGVTTPFKILSVVLGVAALYVLLGWGVFVLALAWTMRWSVARELTGVWHQSLKNFVLGSVRNALAYLWGGAPEPLGGELSPAGLHTFGMSSAIFALTGIGSVVALFIGDFDLVGPFLLFALPSVVIGTLVTFLSQPGIKEILLSAPAGLLMAQALQAAGRPDEFLNFVDGTMRVGHAEIPVDVENLSFAFFGSPGSGKSQSINRLILTIRHRGQCAIVADVGGEAMGQMAKAGDAVLNPLDARSVKWSPFAEMENKWDAETIAKSIIPDLEGSAKEWSTYAQVLLGAVMQRLWETGKATNGNLLHYLVFAKPNEIEALIAGLPVQALFDKGSAKMLSNVRSIVGSSVGPYAYLDPATGPDGFSIRKFVQEKSSQADAPFLWIPYRDSQTAVLASMIASWMDIASQTLLDLETDRNRRFWFVADEFSSLGRINSIMQLLAKGRKKGVGAIFGIQTIAQIRQSYGREGAQVLMTCLQTWVAFRSRDPETQKYLSELAGDHKYTREETSVSERGGFFDSDKSTTTAVRHVTEPRILASEFGRLATRHGFMSIPGPFDIEYVVAPIVALEQRAKNFVPVQRSEPEPVVNVKPINVIELDAVARQQEKENPEGIQKLRHLFPAGKERIPSREEVEDEHELAVA